MVGFVFFPPSPRDVGMAVARTLGQRAKDRARKVALSVDADDVLLATIVDVLRPDVLQLHGKETPARVQAIRTRFGLPVMKAIAVETRADLAVVDGYAGTADRLLFDARAPREQRGPAGLESHSTGTSWKTLGPRRSFHALGRPRPRQCRHRVAHHRRARRRRVIGRRTRSRREGFGQNPRFHRRGARNARIPSPPP